MALVLLVLSIVVLVGTLACGGWSYKFLRRKTMHWPTAAKTCGFALTLPFMTGGLIGLLWYFLRPPPFSVDVSGPPSQHRNDPSRSVYFGNGCFWHTQYDFVQLEQEASGSFGNRADQSVTSLVGYAGGRYMSANGAVCYHGLPHTDYDRLGHAEAVSIMLDDGNQSLAQLAELAADYFEHGFQNHDGRRQRLDPQDVGAAYRNVIGLPGGMDNAELWPIIANSNKYGMPLKRAAGGSTEGDTEGEYVVYIYNSINYPFFRGETYHQFHSNDVIGREVPIEYLTVLKSEQKSIGRLDDDLGCAELPFGLELLILFAFALPLACGGSYGIAVMPVQYRFWERISSRNSIDAPETEMRQDHGVQFP